MNIPVVFKYMIPNENTERPDVVILCEGKAISLEFKTFGNIVDMDYVMQYIGYIDFFENYHKYDIEHSIQVESYLVMSASNQAEIVIEDDVREKYSVKDLQAIIGIDKFDTIIRSVCAGTPMQEVDDGLPSKRSRSLKVWETAGVI